jgi:uncharacterized transporter YbjL
MKIPFDLPGRMVGWGQSGLKVFQDLFKGPANVYWDLGRWVVGICVILMVAATIWNMYIDQPIDLGPGGLGGGLAGLLTAGAALIAAKDYMHKRGECPKGDDNEID